MYQIQVDELDLEAEMQKIAFKFFRSSQEKQDIKCEDNEEQRAFDSRAKELQDYALEFQISQLKDDQKCEKATMVDLYAQMQFCK